MSSSSSSSSSSAREHAFDSWQETSRNTLRNGGTSIAQDKDNKEDITSNRPSPSIMQHPVISVVLWLFGGKQSNRIVETKKGVVKWKDDRGMEHNISEVLGNGNDSNSVSSESDADVSSQSPQWGFYVTMTPPTQESYVRAQQQNTQRPNSPGSYHPETFTGFAKS